MGVGGVVILGAGAKGDIGKDLADLLRAAPHGIKPFIASDEEGGQVQRLRYVIYPLPSARVMGRWSVARTMETAKDYGARLRKLHVSVVFGPVADLDVPGRYMSGLDRCFSSRPQVVGGHVAAWVTGLRSSGVLATVKHWPGHGWAADTHGGAARIPSLSRLRREDMVPFERAFAAGVSLVMVGHLQSKGLTEDDTPASLSPSAMRYLRARVGDDTVIITDSLSMAATTKALGIEHAGGGRARSPGRRRPRALRLRESARGDRRGHGGHPFRAAAAKAGGGLGVEEPRAEEGGRPGSLRHRRAGVQGSSRTTGSRAGGPPLLDWPPAAGGRAALRRTTSKSPPASRSSSRQEPGE